MGFNITANLQAPLHASNEEWLVLGPMLQKVMAARQAAMVTEEQGGIGGAGGDFMGGRGGGGRGGMGNDTFGGPSSEASGGRGGRGGRGGGRGGPGGPGFGPGGPGGDFSTMGGPQNNAQPMAQNSGAAPAAAAAPKARAPAANPVAESNKAPEIITLAQALSDLRTAVADPSSSEKQIKDLLVTVRAARAKADAEVKAAEHELEQVITIDQKAYLVSEGYVD